MATSARLSFLSLPVLGLALHAALPALAVGRPHEPRVHPSDVKNAQLLATAELRLAKGQAAAALEALWSIDDSRPKLDRFTRARLLGRAAFAAERYEDARAALEEARALTVARGYRLRADLELLRARAEHALGHCEPALAALERAGRARFDDAPAVIVEAACLAEDGLRAGAVEALSAGLARQETGTLRAARARLLLDIGARAAALVDARSAAAALPLEDALLMAHDFVEAGALSEATELLRAMRQRAPDDVRPRLALSRLVTGREAASVAVEAARLDPSRRADAAELLRRDGALSAALRETAGIADARARLRARLAVLIDARAWDRALALQAQLRDADLSKDDAVRYALAFAAFSVGDDTQASAFLDGIVDAGLFERASRLRVAIAACAETDSPCAR